MSRDPGPVRLIAKARAYTHHSSPPVNPSLPYRWYDTPNIHLCTIEDFNNWAAGAGVKIIECHVLAEGEVRASRADDNLFAEEALFVLEDARG